MNYMWMSGLAGASLGLHGAEAPKEQKEEKKKTQCVEVAPVEVDEAQIPSVISEQFTKLQSYKTAVDRSVKKADSAMDSARDAHGKSAGLFHRKEAIESLQDAVVENADALGSFADAQKVSFEYQQKLGEMCKYLFGIGVSNMAANRSVVRELELKLKGASEQELDELARQEIYGVLRQLKAQEDIMQKQAQLTDKVKAQGQEFDARLTEREQADKAQDAALLALKTKDSVHDRRLDTVSEKDAAQDAELKDLKAKDAEHDKRLDTRTEKDEEQDRELARQASADTALDEKLLALEAKVAALEETCTQLRAQLDAADTARISSEDDLRRDIRSRFTFKASMAAAVIGALGLIAAIVSFFL